MSGQPDGEMPPEVVEVGQHCFDLARQGRSDELAAYLDAGVPVELTDVKGNTLMMLAAYHGQASTVRLLLERGAHADVTNDRGQTPLAGAVFKGEADVVRALVAGGADPDAGAPSAREAARFFDQPDMLALLTPDA